MYFKYIFFRLEQRLTEECLQVNNNLLLTEKQGERNTTYLAKKRSRLKNKQVRIVSHK